ncbi:MAG: terminase family protein [Patescibacteria group bacterium]|nr:terminase family protein [Patescibacteria group bacterium]
MNKQKTYSKDSNIEDVSLQSRKDKAEELALIAKQSRSDLISYAMLMDPTYEPNWHHEMIANKLMEVSDGKCKRLIVQMPPRHGKSRLISELFPSWELGKHPYKEIMLASYSENLSKEFSGKARDLVNEDVYPGIFGKKLRRDMRGKGHWSLQGTAQGRGGMRAVGLNGSITGKGANIFIVDDPIRNRQDADSKVIRDTIWGNFRSAVDTRLKPDDVVIIVLTTWHLDDLIGRIKANLKEHEVALEDEWDIIKLPAIAMEDEHWEVNGEVFERKMGEALWEDHFPLKFLEKKKRDVGIVEFSSLYQQSPISGETQIFRQDQFLYRTEEDLLGKEMQRYLTVDPSVGSGDKSDYTGFCDNRVDRDNFWNIMGWHKRVGPQELIDTLFALHSENRYDRIGIEETMYEMAIRPFLQQEMIRRNMFLPLVQLKHLHRSKVSRIGDLESRYASGRIFHLKHMCKDMEEEFLTYPRGVHDDIIDAVAYQVQITEDFYNSESGDFPDDNLFDKNGFY